MRNLILTLFLILFAGLAHAESNLPLDSFAELPILHDGRVKPIDTFARIELLKFSKKDTIDGKDAVTWLAGTLFDPGSAPDEKIFLITNANTRHLMGLEERKKPLYSFSELSLGLEKTSSMLGDFMSVPPKQQTADQKDLLRTHENALEYTLILRSFSSLLPLNIQLPPDWRKKAGLPDNQPVTYLALKKIEQEVDATLKGIIKHKGKNPEKYSRQEQATAMLGWQLQVVGKAGENNALLRVIPLAEDKEWASPWELINDGKGTPSTGNIIEKWKNLAKAWQTSDEKLWNENLSSIQGLYEQPHRPDTQNGKLWLETTYNHIAPFTTSIYIFAASMVFGFLNLAGRYRVAYRLGLLTLGAALILQALGLSTRIYLMERPPVGTLYESLLFVALIAPLVAFFMELRLKGGIGLVAGGIAGTIIGLLALSMAGEDDTMKVLGAVLNTRFWLTTHVLCITIGYGWCLVTSVMSHLLLVGRATQKMDMSLQTQLLKTIMTLALFSLLFTTVGTILGGIWADQSWGRFWGWDPKENGALLIVLWLLWLIHGKIAAQISEQIWIGGMAFLSVVVATAWIGVNLLGVGLHSYGFIEGVFWGLGGFTIFEIIAITLLITRINKMDKTSHAA